MSNRLRITICLIRSTVTFTHGDSFNRQLIQYVRNTCFAHRSLNESNGFSHCLQASNQETPTPKTISRYLREIRFFHTFPSFIIEWRNCFFSFEFGQCMRMLAYPMICRKMKNLYFISTFALVLLQQRILLREDQSMIMKLISVFLCVQFSKQHLTFGANVLCDFEQSKWVTLGSIGKGTNLESVA